MLIAASFFSAPASAQLPKSQELSERDKPLVQAEVARVTNLLSSTPDKATLTYLMARTWAAAKQWPETMEWLRKVIDFNAGLDPSRDSIFSDLRSTREFQTIADAVRESTPPVSRSKPAFIVHEGDLVPESIAYDSRARNFYLGSMNKGEVVRCSPHGVCTQFATGLYSVLGLKAHGSGLWILSNADHESALIHFDLASARMIRRYPVAGPGHNLNDLVFAPSGDAYITDTRAGTVWHLAPGASQLTRLPGEFGFANGIALSSDGNLLYVSTFPDGITVHDLKTQTTAPIARPADLCLATIDGLYFHRNTLIAIQNAFMSPRVIRLTLSRDLRSIAGFEVLERRHPLFDGVTTGVIARGEFFYMANIQDNKKTGFNPLTILKLRP